jgi:hypothetical protein
MRRGIPSQVKLRAALIAPFHVADFDDTCAQAYGAGHGGRGLERLLRNWRAADEHEFHEKELNTKKNHRKGLRPEFIVTVSECAAPFARVMERKQCYTRPHGGSDGSTVQNL